MALLLLGAYDDDNNCESSSSNSPSGIAIETLQNLRTVATLTMEESRLDAYSSAQQHAEPNQLYLSLFVHKGLACGIAVCSEQWVRGL